MPGVTLHLQLGQQVLDHWCSSPAGAPFPAADPECRTAFRMGCMGPDMGYLPGGDRPLSDLAHTVTPGQLTRHILEAASTPLQRAFAWGWAAHVLADLLVHPLVGCAVGEAVHGSPSKFVSGDDDQLNHVRVEMGLDALYAQRLREVERIRLAPVFDVLTVGFLHQGLMRSYGASPSRASLDRSHRNAARRLNQGLRLVAIAGATLPSHRDQTGRDPSSLGRIRSFVSRQSVSLAFLFPAPPRLWLINAVRDVEETFLDIFMEEVESGGAGIPDLHLDTGRPAHLEAMCSARHRALDWLRGAGGQASEPIVPTAGAA